MLFLSYVRFCSLFFNNSIAVFFYSGCSVRERAEEYLFVNVDSSWDIPTTAGWTPPPLSLARWESQDTVFSGGQTENGPTSSKLGNL